MCTQCGTKWDSPGYEPIAYRDWTTHDPEGLPVMDRLKKGLGIYQ